MNTDGAPSRWLAHEKPALIAAGIGAGAAFGAGALDPVAFGFAVLGLAGAWARGRGWAIARLFRQPRFFTVLSAIYLPLFFADLFLSGGPVGALDRLIVFLLVAEVLSGNPRHTHRPVLLGLLLLVSTAAETTDIWFALPMAGFVVAALSAQIRTTMVEHQPAGETPPPAMRLGPLVVVAAGSLALGTLIFFAIPRIGAGWGRQLATQKAQSESALETGLADSVSLGTIGKVKLRRRIAFKATLTGSGSTHLDADSIYWRARPFSLWTGQGWAEDKTDRVSILTLPVARPVFLPGEAAGDEPGLVADIEMRLERAPAVIAPGRPVWIKTPRGTTLMASADGALTDPDGRIPRRYAVAVRSPRLPFVEPVQTPAGPAAGERQTADPSKEPISSRSLAREYPGEGEDAVGTPSATYLESGDQPGEVRAWARRVGADQVDPLRIARAFVADLSRRPYSLDTRGVDPRRPIASFLAGAPAHCEYFASAMVLGLRERGIPARVVGGFLGADRSSFGSEYVVRESRAHMWVEAHIPGSGWTTFDPTPEEGRETRAEWQSALQDAWEQAVRTWDAVVIGFDISSQADLLVWAREIVARSKDLVVQNARLVSIALGAAAIVVFALVRRRRRRRASTSLETPGIPQAYRRLLAHAASRGLHPAPGETAREFARRAGTVLGDPRDVAYVSQCYERERFGGEKPTEQEMTSLKEALHRLLRSLPGAPSGASPSAGMAR